MEKRVVMEKMQILHLGRTNQDGFMYLRTLIFSVSLMLLLGMTASMFFSILKKTESEENCVEEIIKVENERMLDENN